MNYHQNKIWFDLESTGLNFYHEKIIEFGAINSKNETFSTLVNPGIEISEKITQITNITNEMVKDAPNEEEAFKKFIDFCNNSFRNTSHNSPIYLIAHNGNNFDFMFLKTLSKRYRVALPNFVYIDTINISKLLWPERWSHSLATLCKYYHINQDNAHRAFEDTQVLKTITEQMLSKFDKVYGISDMKSVYDKINCIW